MGNRRWKVKLFEAMRGSILDGFFHSSEFLALTSGYRPISRTARFDDVHLIQGRRHVAWSKVQLISQWEMMRLNKRAVDTIFNVLLDDLRLGLDYPQIDGIALLSQCLACHCFRDTPIEEIHRGLFPFDMHGSPIIVRDAERDTPWKGVSRIVDESELRRVAHVRLSQVLPQIGDVGVINTFIRENRGFVLKWDQPTALAEFRKSSKIS